MTTTTVRAHGTRAKYAVERCRCTPCRAASRAYENWRHRQIAYGRSAYVDADPVRAHVRNLSEQGLGWKRAAQLAGLTTSTVWKLLYGDPGRGMAPSKRVRRRTAAALLAVTADLDNLGATVPVPAVGPRRRLQALVAIGWSQTYLANRMGVGVGSLNLTLHGPSSHVRAATARAARDLYDELWNTRPAQPNPRTLAAAQRHGWAPPLAWDDDTIDDPATAPAHGLTAGQRYYRDERRTA